MKKVLIVDDDVELRANLSEILKGAGYYIAEAPSGKEAIEEIASKDFDIVLLDLMMPKMSGLDVLKEIKKIKPKIKVIMITAFATVENAVDAIKKGASDYISKPFRIDGLLTTIRRVIEEGKFEEGITKLNLDYTLSSLSNPIRRNIIRLLQARKSMRLMEIVRELGIEDHTKVVFHLKMLKESDIIEQDTDKSYSLTEEGERILSCLKILENYLSA
ncbi:MAG: response regulator [Nitrospirae bacterium]|nr:response regulator [Nitrospirota bacterium]MBI3377150.1 response regulator [Nitrospirota bacterium]